jgi:hypothetical protein
MMMMMMVFDDIADCDVGDFFLGTIIDAFELKII